MDELDAESRETLMKANLDLLVAMLVLALGLLHVKIPFEGGQDETKKIKDLSQDTAGAGTDWPHLHC